MGIIPTILFPTILWNLGDENKIIPNVDDVDLQKSSKLQIPFIENIGQKDAIVKFYAKTFAGTVFVTDSNLTYQSVINNNQEYFVLVEKFVDAKINPEGKFKTNSKINYYQGNKENWQENIPAYGVISLGTLWNNVDVSLQAYENNVEKIFTVFPEGDPKDILLEFDGISKLSTNESGELEIQIGNHHTKFSTPIAFQYILGEKIPVDVEYVIDNNSYGFLVDDYRKDLPLVIDPLIASTFIGSDSDEDEGSIALDSNGNVFIAAVSFDSDYPIVPSSGAYQTSPAGGDDVVISKFNSALTSLLASTFIGGSEDSEDKPSIAIDSSDNVFIASATNSGSYPTSSGFQNTKEDNDDIVISKFTNNLSLSASTFLGGDGDDSDGGDGAMIAIDSSDNVYVVGTSSSDDFPQESTSPTATSFDSTSNGGVEVVVAKLNNSLSSLLAFTYLGGSGSDFKPTLDLDSSGNVFVVFGTSSSNVEVGSGLSPYLNSRNTSDDIFIAKLDSTLSNMLGYTYYGGSGDEDEAQIGIDNSDNVFVIVSSESNDLPTAGTPFDSTYAGGSTEGDPAIAKFSNSLSSLLAFTYLGGSADEQYENIEIDNSGNVFVAFQTDSSGLATAGKPVDSTFGGSSEIFIGKLDNSLSSLLASTYLGGSGTANSDLNLFQAFTLDDSGNVYITTETASSTFPTSPDTGFLRKAFQTTNPGNDALTVSIINCNLSNGTACVNISDGSQTIAVGEDDKSGIFKYSGTTLNVTAPSGTAAATTVQVQINDNNDDVEQAPNTFLSLSSSDLELVNDGGSFLQQVGLRFNSISVPKDSVITDAFIQFTVDDDDTDTETTNLVIKGEATDNAAAFNFDAKSLLLELILLHLLIGRLHRGVLVE